MDATALVKAWFSQANHFRSSGKSDTTVARVLLQGIDLTGKDVLNLGCFYPEDELAYGAQAKRWVAVDFCEPVLEWCRAVKNMPTTVEFQFQDIRQLTFWDASFDLVLDFSTGDHLIPTDFTQMVLEAKRVLRPNGLFLCTYQNAKYFVGEPLEYWEQDTGYSRSMTPDTAGLLIQSAGFYILKNIAETEPQAGLIAQKK